MLAGMTANQRAFYDLWLRTLDDGRGHTAAEEGATQLTIARIQCQKRGMPDMHPDEEAKIMSKAFEIHQFKTQNKDPFHLSDRQNIMTCFWCEHLTNVCHCFEEARALLMMEEDRQMMIAAPIQVTDEDRWYEPRYV